jgi:hypothetical protein
MMSGPPKQQTAFREAKQLRQKQTVMITDYTFSEKTADALQEKLWVVEKVVD